MNKFIDISNNQGMINLTKVVKDNNLDMVFLKSSEGLGWEDPNLSDYYQELKKLNVKIGLYHFSRFDDINNSPIAEAKSFVKIAKKYDVDFYALDFETGTAGRNAKQLCGDFIKEAKKVLTKDIWLYSFENEYKVSNLEDLGYKNWVASYGSNNGKAQNKPKIKNLIAWQYTSVGKLSGYNGNLDLNEGYYQSSGNNSSNNSKKWTQISWVEADKLTSTSKKTGSRIKKAKISGKYPSNIQTIGYSGLNTSKNVVYFEEKDEYTGYILDSTDTIVWFEITSIKGTKGENIYLDLNEKGVNYFYYIETDNATILKIEK